VAHPDDESFGLGAVLSSFVDHGTTVSVLCLTHGEASTLHGVDGDLGVVRAGELAAAAQALGVQQVQLLDYPDGDLTSVSVAALAHHAVEVAREIGAEGIVAFCSDGVTGHPDHVHATEAARLAAEMLGVGALAWTLPSDVARTLAAESGASFGGQPDDQIDIVLTVDRTAQLQAARCHPSQAVPSSVLWRRLELLGDHEHLRWLVPPPPPSA
jgi:LmbE family N-acetylglucosaminyl deacetylase